MQQLPFKGQDDMLTALAAGETAWSRGGTPLRNAMYKANKVRYLAVAVAGLQRNAQTPDVPVSAEAGGPKDFVQSSFVVLATTEGVSAVVRQKIAQDVATVMQEPKRNAHGSLRL